MIAKIVVILQPSNNSTGDIMRCDNARVWNQNAQRVSDFKDNPLNRQITRFDKSIYMNYAHWRAIQSIVVDSGFIADEGQIVKMSAANSITLRPGVKIKEGAKFLATNKVDYNYSNYPLFVPETHHPRVITDNQIIISPNPASSYIRILLPNIGKHKSTSISIVDISGKHQLKIINAENIVSSDNTYQIGINSLPNGLYLVVMDVDDVIYTNKFIKQQ